MYVYKTIYIYVHTYGDIFRIRNRCFPDVTMIGSAQVYDESESKPFPLLDRAPSDSEEAMW
jgi:hypothetical protein